MVSFSQVPANWNLPLVSIEVDGSKAGTVTLIEPALLVGQKFASAPADVDKPIPIASQAQAAFFFGQGSMLERMCNTFFKNTPAALLWCLPQAEPSSGQAAGGSISYAATTASAGTLPLYIAGRLVSIAVTANMSASALATAVVAAIAADPYLPVTAAVDGSINSKVNLTCKWKGSTGNDIQIAHAFGGLLANESIPAGIVPTVVAMNGGTGAPDQTASIASVGDEQYDYAGVPYTDTTSLGAWETEYGFSQGGRWGFLRESYGFILTAVRGSYSSLITFGQAGNSPVSTALGIEVNAQTPVWEWTAAYTAQAALALLNDPARPLQTLPLLGCVPAPKGQRFSKTERNNLSGYGVATQTPDSAGQPCVERETLRYQKNVYGQGDTAFALATTLATLAYILRFLRQRITSKYPRHKLANDGIRVGPGQAIVTPKTIKAELIAAYAELEYAGVAENINAFKDALVVERSRTNADRVDILYPPDLVNALRVFAVLAQFRLQFPDQPGAIA